MNSSLRGVTARATTVDWMRQVEVTLSPGSERRQPLVALVERLAEEARSRPLSDHLWLDLKDGGAAGSISVSVADPTGIIALAQIAHANDGSVLEVVVEDSQRFGSVHASPNSHDATPPTP